MSDPLADLLATLDLADTGARTSEDIFTGPSQWMPHGRVFGGQVLAQSLVAAQRTVEPDRTVHSAHAYFLRPGNIDLPITFAVDRLHDGRSYSRRSTIAYQGGVPIFSLMASFQDHDPGLDHQVEMPADLPAPEDLPAATDILETVDNAFAHSWVRERPFEIRHVESPIYFAVDGPRVAHQAVWVKAIGRMPDDPNLHRAALAYASDYTLLESVLRRHGVPFLTPGLKIASLDHAMWWHRPSRVDEWFLYAQESPTAIGGRGLATGRIFSRDGALVASVAQEGMIRVPRA